MQVAGLRIHGFKSFVDEAYLPVEPGVTGIVGPNGCGKSNVIDALRFVMGETSYKAMRGGGMDDVIFSGSASRPSRDIAEVVLFAERPAVDGDGVDVLEVSRRIERELGSTFRVNGQETRARDVQLIFADAATGAHSAALVRQGQVAELIAAKPAQRRGILEDAAGIAGLYARRAEAEGKLKAAETNLERLDDLVIEIAGQLESLLRQARLAVRYRRLSNEIAAGEAGLFVMQWRAASRLADEAEATRDAAALAFTEAAAAQVEAAKAEAVAAAGLTTLRERAAAALAALQRARFAGTELDREEASLAGRRTDLALRLEVARADQAHESDVRGDAEAAVQRLDAEGRLLVGEANRAKAALSLARDEMDAAAAAVAVAQAAFEVDADAAAAALAEETARERAESEAGRAVARLESERDKLSAEHERLAADSESPDERAQRVSLLDLAAAGSETAESVHLAAEAALAWARDAEAAASRPHRDAEGELKALQAEARTLAGLFDVEATRRFPPLLDRIEVTPGYEAALGAALGDDLDASLDPEAPVHWSRPDAGGGDPLLPAGVRPLFEVVRAPPELSRRLHQVGIVDSPDAAAPLSKLLPGQRLVTREGQLWRWDGLEVKAATKTAEARKLEQRARVAAVLGRLKIARSEAELASTAFLSAEAGRMRAEAEENRTRTDARTARGRLDAARTASADAERRQARVAERLSSLAGALARVEADLETARAVLADTVADRAAPSEHAVFAERQKGSRDALESCRERLTQARLRVDGAAAENAMRLRRGAELAADRERWASRLTGAESHAAELEARRAAIQAEFEAAEANPDEMAQRRRRLLAEMGRTEAAAAATADTLARAESEHRLLTSQAKSAIDKLAAGREARGRSEEKATAAVTRRDELVRVSRDRFGCPPQDVGRVAGLPEPDAAAANPADLAETVASLQERIASLRSERERLGAVNLLAGDEAAEADKRLAAMRAERDDVQAAIDTLRTGIGKLNRDGRERIRNAFEAVNEHFGSLFTHLFGGGTAELMLIGDDPLDAGLEIVARPPGKKPQVMTLLSGGEQALTALALIFAVFLTNPSPICVLDEVDAPLDDANVERFCALLDEMRSRTETRFLVVTHNPITMARMDRLLGVTMVEKGVSQIVSVDLGTAEQMREAS